MLRTALVVLLLSLSSVGQAQQIIPAAQLERMKSILPKLDDEDFQAVIDDPTTMWYDLQSMPAAYQHANGNGYVDTTFHDPRYNISGDPSDQPLGHGRGGNANVEFPWNTKPGGAHRAPYVDSFKGLWLPKKENGQPWPVVVFRQNVPARGERIISNSMRLAQGQPSRFNRGWGWIFPRGAVLIEAITTKDKDGYYVVFELRFRIREEDDWGVEVFRPFPEAKDLVNRIKVVRPEWQEDKRLRDAIAQLENPNTVRRARLADTRHTSQRAIDVTMGVDQIPSLGHELVNDLLLSTTFKSSLGQTWKGEAFAPSNERNEHNIVSFKYDGTFVGTDRDSCIKCHESANQHATVFQQPRGWYGRVRGSDGILSWHPISPRSISRNGGAVPVMLRQSYVSSGAVEMYQDARHPQSMYRRVKGLY